MDETATKDQINDMFEKMNDIIIAISNAMNSSSSTTPIPSNQIDNTPSSEQQNTVKQPNSTTGQKYNIETLLILITSGIFQNQLKSIDSLISYYTNQATKYNDTDPKKKKIDNILTGLKGIVKSYESVENITEKEKVNEITEKVNKILSDNIVGGRKTKKRYTKKRYTKKTKKSKKQKGGYMYSQKKKRKSIKSTYHL
jgi:hypothetical protein